jgi:putative transposase
MAEWDRCRWVWNECVAKSKAVHLHNKATGGDWTCGPAQLDKMLTEARKATPWLREGSSVPQQQIIRDFGKSRAKAQKDIKARLPMARRAGMPKWKKEREDLPTLNYTRRGFRLKDGELHLAGGIALTVVWSRDLPADPSSVRIYQGGTTSRPSACTRPPANWVCACRRTSASSVSTICRWPAGSAPR